MLLQVPTWASAGLSLHGFGQGRLLDLVFVVACAGLVAWRLGVAPYLVVLGTCFQTTQTHILTSDGDVLTGVALGAAAGLASRRPTWNRPSWVLIAFGAFNLAVVASWIANGGGGHGNAVRLGSEYFLLRTALLIVIFLLVPAGRGLRTWLEPVAAAALLLALLRSSQFLGLPLVERLHGWGISTLGDVSDVGTWNAYAAFVALGLALILELATQPRVKGSGAVWLGATFLAAAAMATASSRTAALILIVLLALTVVVRRSRRAVAVAGAVAAIYLFVSLSSLGQLGQKPVVISSAKLGGAPVGQPLELAPLPPGGNRSAVSGPPRTSPAAPEWPPLAPEWRSVLDRLSYRSEQIVDAADPARDRHVLGFLARSTAAATDVVLAVTVNGRRVAALDPAQAGAEFRWVMVPLPPELGAGPYDILFSVTGRPDSRSNYFLIGGRYGHAQGVTSRFLVGTAVHTETLTSDPGRQTGVLLAFIDSVPQLEAFPAPAGSGRVLDPSLSDRLELWKVAIAISAAHPMVGSGFYTFGQRKAEIPGQPLLFDYANAHSNYMQVLSDLGLLGLLGLLAFFLVGLAAAARHLRSRPPPPGALGLAGALAGVMISSLSQTWLADSRLYLAAWAVVLSAGALECGPGSLRVPGRGGRWRGLPPRPPEELKR